MYFTETKRLREYERLMQQPPCLRLKYIESEMNPMVFKNEKHQTAFEAAIGKGNEKNYTLLSALYLLTADGRLWNTAKKQIVRSGVCFERIRLPNCTEASYTLLCAAKDLCLGTKHITVSDLADADLIPPRQFALICNAMAIRRFGLRALKAIERYETE